MRSKMFFQNYFQFDPPDDPKEYIHRVGRTARGEGGKGHALLILRPEELGFLRYLRQANVPLNEFEFSWSKVSDIQPQVLLYFKLPILTILFFMFT
jgi:ATP-dependent RNA helicase DDX18/HAS1